MRSTALSRKTVGLLCCLLFSFCAVAQSDDDIATATLLARKYKKDDIILTNATEVYTFGKGVNGLNDKVVEIEQEAEYDFMALKKFAASSYGEFYNKFIQLKSFKKLFKFNNKWVISSRSGIDRSVTDDGIFFDDSRVQYYPLRFDGKGDLNRIQVKKVFTDGKYLTRIFFHGPHPIKEQKVEFRVPDWVKVEFIRKNFDGQKITATQTQKGGFVIHTFTMKDVPALQSEENAIGAAYTEPHVIVQIKSFSNKGEEVGGFDKVDDVYRWNNRLYGMAGNETEVLKTLVQKVTAGKTAEADKIKAIYHWVQDNVRYIAYEDGYSGYIPTAAQNVQSKKFGDCKGMANLLTEMLKMAGFDARFAWVGTREIPYSQSLPALCVNNHAITALNWGGKTYFLDGTEKWAPLGENAFRIQGKEVMIAGGSNFEIKPVPLSPASDNAIATKADFTLTGNALKGKVKVSITGNQRTGFHQVYQDLATTRQKEFVNDFLEFNNDNLVATNISTSDLKNRELPVSIEGDVDLSNTVSTISNEQYVGIDFFPKSLENLIPDEKRTRGYDLDDLVQYDDLITLTVPVGKKFIDKPDNLELNFPGYSFKGVYEVAGNKLTLRKTLSISNGMIPKSDFENWKGFIRSIKEFNKYLITVANK